MPAPGFAPPDAVQAVMLYGPDGKPTYQAAAAALSDSLANPTTSQVGADVLAFDPSSNLYVRVRGGTAYASQDGTGADAALLTATEARNYNEATWDRVRNNTQGTALALQSGSVATRTSADIVTYNATRLTLVVVTANKANTPTMTPVVKLKDAGGTNYQTLWTAAAAIAANGTLLYQFGPGLGTAPSGVTESKQLQLGRKIQIVLTYAGNGTTDAIDTTVFYELGV